MRQLLSVHWNVDPVMFHIGSYGLRYYSLGFLLAFGLGLYIMSWIFKREKVNDKYIESLLMYLFLAVLIGARLGHCLFYEPDYFLTAAHWTEIIWPFDSAGHFVGYQGLASHGAALGIVIALWLYWRKYKLNVWWFLDRLSIVVALGGGFIRLGNLFNSEIYGTVTSLPWGFVFERNGETLPKHPTQIYEALSYFIIFAVSMVVYVKKGLKMKCGSMFGWWLVALFTARFLIEFVKNDQVDFEQGMFLNMGQWLSVPFIVGGLVIVLLARRDKFPQGAFPWGEVNNKKTKK
ncbi:MAG: prolipoprotein diacylglyceryl transferase [Bacteroidales bacterium]|nr:prolipoprotein diacylglyceryl transferase [Bacteroidales bacterium]